MKNIVSFGLLVFLLSACHHAAKKKKDGAEIVVDEKGSPDSTGQKPYYDSATGFYIDPSEINSNEPRQFVIKDTVPKK